METTGWEKLKLENIVSGIEISDVLKIDDKDYSITFSLYFNVQWSEPRLNLSTEFFDVGNNTGDDELLVPGKELFWTLNKLNSMSDKSTHPQFLNDVAVLD